MTAKTSWSISTLGECATWYSGGTPSRSVSRYWGGEIPWISAKSLVEFYVSDSEEKVTEEGAHNGTRIVPKDTILFVVRGMSLKNEFRLGLTTRPVTFNQDLKALVPHSKIDATFLAYAIRAQTNEILQLVGEAGHGTGVLPTDRMQSLEIAYPSLSEQKQIARVLQSVDFKIDLHRRINQTLEAMAQAIFKSWFVDFDPVKAKIAAKQEDRDPLRAAMSAISGKPDAELDTLPHEQFNSLATTAGLFPDEMEESELGEIPKGWESSTLKELTKKIGSGATPRGGKEVYIADGVALIRSQNVYDEQFVWDGLARISDQAADQLKNVEICEEDVLLNITGASILRTCVVVSDVLPARVNQHVAIIRAKDDVPPRFIHLHLLQKKTKDYLLGLNAGASREAITKGHIESTPVIRPSSDILVVFRNATGAVYKQKDILAAQSRILASLRDTLLPKLLSGELSVNIEDHLTTAAGAP